MLCPMKFNKASKLKDDVNRRKFYNYNECQCEEEECAWWDLDMDYCVIKNLTYLTEVKEK